MTFLKSLVSIHKEAALKKIGKKALKNRPQQLDHFGLFNKKYRTQAPNSSLIVVGPLKQELF